METAPSAKTSRRLVLCLVFPTTWSNAFLHHYIDSYLAHTTMELRQGRCCRHQSTVCDRKNTGIFAITATAVFVVCRLNMHLTVFLSPAPPPLSREGPLPRLRPVSDCIIFTRLCCAVSRNTSSVLGQQSWFGCTAARSMLCCAFTGCVRLYKLCLLIRVGAVNQASLPSDHPTVL